NFPTDGLLLFKEGKVMNKKLVISDIALLMSAVVVACSGNDENTPDNAADTEDNSTENTETDESADSMDETDDTGMDHSSSGEVPDDLADAKDPTYPVGSEAVIHANHMEGMDSAVATIVGE